MNKPALLCTFVFAALACGVPTTSSPEPTPEPDSKPTVEPSAPAAVDPEPEPVAAAEDEQSVRPGVNDGYSAKPVENFVESFENEGREVYDRREWIVDAMGIKPGEKLVDIGAGTGLFMPLFSKAVGPKGHVTAVDIVPNFLVRLRERAKAHPNVSVVTGEEKRLLVEPGSQDRAVLIDVYHHVEYPRLFMRSVREGLRPGGEVIIVDFRRVEGQSEEWVFDHVRAGQALVTQEVTDAGFELVEARDGLKQNYFLRFRRK